MGLFGLLVLAALILLVAALVEASSPMTARRDAWLPEPVAADWLRSLRICLGVTLLGQLAWETLRLPLFTIWTTGTHRRVLRRHRPRGQQSSAAITMVAR